VNRAGLWGAALLSLSLARPAAASGFLIYDLSAEGMARGSAVSADIHEPSAIWFNPAALAYLEGVNLQLGGVYVTSRARFVADADGSETRTERGHHFIPTLYGHAALSERVSVGIGAYSAFGIAIEWPDDWIGRESTIEASLQTLDLNPTVAVRLNRQASLALGFNAVRGLVDFSNGLPAPIGGSVRLGGGTWGYGLNAGALIRVVPDQFHLAATFRSRVQLDFEGRADFQPGSADFERVLPDQPGTAGITLPDILTFGLMARPNDDLALTLDANLVFWQSYDRIDIDFETAPDSAIVSNGHMTVTLRAGADYRLPGGFHARGGLIYDRGAIPEENLGPALPDADRIDVTAGLGYTTPHLDLDLGYMIVKFLPSDATTGHEGPEGTYHTLAHLLALTVGASFR
jgi:long-chain fatty acid transport protein